MKKTIACLFVSFSLYAMDRDAEIQIYKSGLAVSNSDVVQSCLKALGNYGEGYDIIYQYLISDSTPVQNFSAYIKVFISFKKLPEFRKRCEKILNLYPSIDAEIRLSVMLAIAESGTPEDVALGVDELTTFFLARSVDRRVNRYTISSIKQIVPFMTKDQRIHFLGLAIPFMKVGASDYFLSDDFIRMGKMIINDNSDNDVHLTSAGQADMIKKFENYVNNEKLKNN